MNIYIHSYDNVFIIIVRVILIMSCYYEMMCLGNSGLLFKYKNLENEHKLLKFHHDDIVAEHKTLTVPTIRLK